MNGRFNGEFWSHDIGLAIALKRRAYGRFQYELFFLIGPVSLSIGFVPHSWSRR